jgi:hypothetical protein
MSRSGYSDDCDGWELICWRGAVASAIRGNRGQSFLRELLAALDALPAPRLIAHDLVKNGEVCAIGSVGLQRGVDMSKLEPSEPEPIAETFGIAGALVKEIEFVNDGDFEWRGDMTPERRFQKVRAWVLENIVVRSDELLATDSASEGRT